MNKILQLLPKIYIVSIERNVIGSNLKTVAAVVCKEKPITLEHWIDILYRYNPLQLANIYELGLYEECLSFSGGIEFCPRERRDSDITYTCRIL